LARGLPSVASDRRLRYVPLLAAGLLVFLGLVFLGKLTGLTWHSSTFHWRVPLDSSAMEPTADWVVWNISFFISIFPSILAFAQGRRKPDAVLVLAFLIYPLLWLVTVTSSYYIGATLVVGSGFLVAYALVSRSELLLKMNRGHALRVVCTEVFAFLAVASAGGVVALLLQQQWAFSALVLRQLTNPLVRMLSIDMEVFYLARPLLLELFFAVAAVSIVSLFRDNFQSIFRRLIGKGSIAEGQTSPSSASQSASESNLRTLLPYIILVGSIVLGIAITIYPYTVAKVEGVLGSDMGFYAERLRAMKTALNLSVLPADRALFMLILYSLMSLTGLQVTWVLRLAPALCSTLLAMSAFAFVKEGTDRRWLASLAAVLSVVSAQTSLGMGGGILAGWFSLSVVNFMLALLLRSIRLSSKRAAAGSLILSLVLLGSYTYMWVVTVAIIVAALVATLLSFRSRIRLRWRSESTFLVVILVGTLALPIALGYVLLLGHVPGLLDPIAWINIGLKQLTGKPFWRILRLAPLVLEGTFDFAGNRIDLPFLAILSIVGLADSAWDGMFRRITAAMVLVPFALVMITLDPQLTWRGLYIMPFYLTGALGIGSIIRRVNAGRPPWGSPSRLAFVAAFSGYVFLSLLSYSLRALELLILIVTSL
jgi:hypothetical protein